MARSVGIAVIGMGWMGQVHSRAYLQVPDRFHDCGVRPRLVVCADDVEARARQGQQRFGFLRATTDWREALADAEVQAVNITTPNHLHLPIVEAAVAAGKHVFCEKPVGRGPEEAIAAADAARRAGVITWTGYNYRWAPLVQHARQLIAQGALGRITHYRGRFLSGYASAPQGALSWRFLRDSSGSGVMGDLMSHVIDMAHFLAGPVRRVVSQRETFIRQRPLAEPGAGTHFSKGGPGPTGEVENEDYTGALVEFGNGARGTLEACRVIQGAKCEHAFEIHGERGAIRWNFERMNELQVYFAGDAHGEGYRTIFSNPEHPFHAAFNPGSGVGLGYDDLKTIEAAQFLKSIAEGRQGEPGFREARAVAEAQAAMMRSWETGAWEIVRP
jgi:predicted dehydrogenase